MHVVDDRFGFHFREYGGDVFGFGRAKVIDGGLVQFDLQDIAIEKQDGAEGLILLAPTARTVWVEAETFFRRPGGR